MEKVFSTKLYCPLKLARQITFNSEQEAVLYEHRIKDVRREKEKVIREIESGSS